MRQLNRIQLSRTTPSRQLIAQSTFAWPIDPISTESQTFRASPRSKPSRTITASASLHAPFTSFTRLRPHQDLQDLQESPEDDPADRDNLRRCPDAESSAQSSAPWLCFLRRWPPPELTSIDSTTRQCGPLALQAATASSASSPDAEPSAQSMHAWLLLLYRRPRCRERCRT